MNVDETILVTGAAGFIGSRLASALLKRGFRVVGLDNFDPYYPLTHKQRNLDELREQRGFILVEADVRDGTRLRQILHEHRPSVVAHIAAMASVRYSVEHPLLYGQVNVQGTLNLMDAARLEHRPRLVLASTGSVYGASTPLPFVESAPATFPLAPYPASKRAMELFAQTYAHLYKMDITVLRFFNVYGPHGRPDMMPWRWTEQLLRGETLTLFDEGRLKRDWTYIDDLVDGFVAALERPMEFEIINLGAGNPVANIEFVRTLENILNCQAKFTSLPAPASEPPITFADITKARRLLGYNPKVDVEEGLRRFVEWTLKSGAIKTQ